MGYNQVMSIDPEFNINPYDLVGQDCLGDSIDNKSASVSRGSSLKESITRYWRLFLEGMAHGGLGNTYGVPPLTEVNRMIDLAVNEGENRLGDPGDLVEIVDREALFGLKGSERK